MTEAEYDVIIIGGGLAGLSAAILTSEAGYSTLLLEKNSYPHHKVCGEYISCESLEFLQRIHFNPSEFNLPEINKLKITSGKTELTTKLPLGGIGVSRFFLDEKLMTIAKQNGVTIKEKTTVLSVERKQNLFYVNANDKSFISRIVLGAFGKRSNINRGMDKSYRNSNNYIGVKYHVLADLPHDIIELHIFKNGYCGISKVERENTYCMCYMTTAQNLKSCNNIIEQLEEKILSKNPVLKRYFRDFKKVTEKPVTISQISFGIKNIIWNNMIMLGDAAGTIAPLCGNGMSMAFHSSHTASLIVDKYLKGLLSYDEVINDYSLFWKSTFQRRISTSCYFQKIFMNKEMAAYGLMVLKQLPSLHSPLIKLTHGENFINSLPRHS